MPSESCYEESKIHSLRCLSHQVNFHFLSKSFHFHSKILPSFPFSVPSDSVLTTQNGQEFTSSKSELTFCVLCFCSNEKMKMKSSKNTIQYLIPKYEGKKKKKKRYFYITERNFIQQETNLHTGRV